MSDSLHADDTNRWKQLLTLAELLIDQPSAATQQELIEGTASRLLNGLARLWLSGSAFNFPGYRAKTVPSSNKQSRLMRQVLQQERTLASPIRKKNRTSSGFSMATPLHAKDGVFGVLEIERPDGPEFDQTDRECLERIASISVAALQVTRQVGIKNWRYEQLSLVRDVSSQIANVLDLDELSRQVTRLIRDTFQYYFVAIFTLEPAEDLLRFRACAHQARSAPDGSDLPAPQIHLGQGMIGYVAQTGVELLAPDILQEPRYRHFDSLPETRSEMAFPLKVENRVLGVLDVQSNQTDAFHEIDVLVLRALADNVALAIEGARLYSDLQHRAEQLAIVGEVGRKLTSILELDPLLEEVVTLIQKRLGYPFVHIFTVHPGRRKVIYRAGSGSKNKGMHALDVSYNLDNPLGIISWVARNGKTFIANDVDAEPIYRPSELPPHNTRAEMTVPLVYGGEVSGVLDIQSDRREAFSEDDRFLFEALADTISIAMHNAMLYRSERWRRQVAESLRDVAGLLSSEPALDRVLDAILDELKRNLPCEIAAIWLLDEKSVAQDDHDRMLRLAAVHGGDREKLFHAAILAPESKQVFIDVMENNTPVIRSAADPMGLIGIGFKYPADYSSIIAPLLTGDQPLGILVLAHPTTGRYGSEALSMTTAFASYAAVAIQNNRLYTSAQEQAWVSTVMLQVADAAQTANNIQELFDVILRLTHMLVGVKSSAFFLWNPSLEGFSLAEEYELDPLLKVSLLDQFIRLEAAPALQLLRQGISPVWIQDIAQEFGLFPEATSPISHHPMLLLPLAARGEFIGALLIEQQNSVNGSSEAFSNQRNAILQGIAQQSAIAVENIRLLEAKQEEAYVTAVLLQVAQAVVSLNDLNDILSAITHIMPILVGIDACIIYLWDPEDRQFHPSQAYAGNWRLESELLSRSYAPEEYYLLNEVFQRDSTVICPLDLSPQPPVEWNTIQPRQDPRDEREYLKEKNNLLLGFPLSVKGEVFGILVAKESSTAPELRERRLEIITGIAQQASIAIQNDRLNREMLGRERIEREFQLAREIQQTFLPSELPAPSGWEIAVRWRTARQVGGDFYDCFELPGNRLGLVIADVSDKGMPAALYMTVTRTLIRATALEGDLPSDVLMRVNDLLLTDSKNGMFVTAIYGILSLETGELVYANAGHNLPLVLLNEGKKTEPLSKGGIALGAWENIQLTNHQLQLTPGDMLLLYTDGVTEAFSPSLELFGEKRLQDVVETTYGDSAAQVLDAVDASLTDFLGNIPPSDDITLLAIRRTGPDSSD